MFNLKVGFKKLTDKQKAQNYQQILQSRYYYKHQKDNKNIVKIFKPNKKIQIK